jgi:hypothetical protein
MPIWICPKCEKEISAITYYFLKGAKDSHKLKHLKEETRALSPKDKERRKSILKREFKKWGRLSRFEYEELEILDPEFSESIRVRVD